mmetsp:Transcript_124393/g.265078  ORF Transcript_124393/g.265078 Transcript_124393/m.265078 type:complete len:300 (-) Transcript_124393:71-970(-)
MAETTEAPDQYAEPMWIPMKAEEWDLLPGMRHNNDRLQELLKLAEGCMRSGRCPGDPRPRHLFEMWDAEAAAKAEAQAPDPGEVAEAAPLRPAVPPTPEGLSPEAHAAKVRRDIQRLERLASEKRQELETLNTEIARETLDHCAARDGLEAAQTEAQKARRGLREAKDMVKRQEREIQALRAALEPALATAALKPSPPVAQGNATKVSAADPSGPPPEEKQPAPLDEALAVAFDAAALPTSKPASPAEGACVTDAGIDPRPVVKRTVRAPPVRVLQSTGPVKAYSSVLAGKPKNHHIYM